MHTASPIEVQPQSPPAPGPVSVSASASASVSTSLSISPVQNKQNQKQQQQGEEAAAAETLLPPSAHQCLGPTILLPPSRPPPPKYLYFAYGSNLSPTQMRSRCRIHPSHSAHPLAIASLPHWRWLICERGYANVLPPPALRLVGSQPSRAADQIPVSGHRDAVLGVLYDMDAGDEKILDGYEGVDEAAEEVDGDTSVISPAIRPREQGEGSYNKWYVEAEVEKWLDEKSLEDEVVVGSAGGGGQAPVRVRVLVYVDEEHVLMSRPKAEYIPRMDRAIREAEALGMDGEWLKEVLRKDIPEV